MPKKKPGESYGKKVPCSQQGAPHHRSTQPLDIKDVRMAGREGNRAVLPNGDLRSLFQ